MGRALPVGIVWWIGNWTEGGFACVVDSEGKVARSRRISWMCFVGDTRYCVVDVGGISRISEERD